MSNAFQGTVERLNGYYDFNEAISTKVGAVAEMQAGLSYEEYLAASGIAEPFIFNPDGGKPVRILDIRPSVDFDESKARVMHLAMGNDVDPNQIYQAATVFSADPDTRLIAVGNPAAPGLGYGKLSFADSGLVAKGDLRPVIDPVMKYVEREGITDVEHVGFSYGASRVPVAMKYAAHYEHQADGVAIDPADVKDRGFKLKAMLSLAADFGSTAGPLEDYVQASGIPAFLEARKHSPNLVMYSLGILRASNLAIASALAGDYYQKRATDALEAQPDRKLHTFWGSESELAIDGLLQQITTNLQDRFGERAPATRLIGQKHNMVNDIHLQAALVLHGSRN